MVNGGVIQLLPSFQHEFFEVAVAECITQLPPYAGEHDLGFAHDPCEWVLLHLHQRAIHRRNQAEQFLQEKPLMLAYVAVQRVHQLLVFALHAGMGSVG